MSSVQTPPASLAAALAARLIHDVMGPLSGILSGLDLLNDPAAHDLHADALALAGASARSLHEEMAFSRMLYGSSAAAMASHELEALARGVFVGQRAALSWTVASPSVPAAVGRTVLGFARLAAASVAAGGVVAVDADLTASPAIVRVAATGPRVRFPPEALAGLAGQPLSEGLAGKWAPAFYLWAMATGAGGTVLAEAAETGVTLTARFPG